MSNTATMKIQVIFAWYDLWVGVFYDRWKRKVYILPLPCFGVCITLPKPPAKARQNDELMPLMGLGLDGGDDGKGNW